MSDTMALGAFFSGASATCLVVGAPVYMTGSRTLASAVWLSGGVLGFAAGAIGHYT